jgi:hypothetical protein
VLNIALYDMTGLKYVHATSKGRQGMEGDLEKSRKLLMSKGFISKSNFDGDEEFQKMVSDVIFSQCIM